MEKTIPPWPKYSRQLLMGGKRTQRSSVFSFLCIFYTFSLYHLQSHWFNEITTHRWLISRLYLQSRALLKSRPIHPTVNLAIPLGHPQGTPNWSDPHSLQKAPPQGFPISVNGNIDADAQARNLKVISESMSSLFFITLAISHKIMIYLLPKYFWNLPFAYPAG